MTGFADFALTTKFRDIISKLVQLEIERQRPRIQYALVNTIDRTNRKCTVTLVGDTASSTVSMGAIQPSAIGQVVRIDGIPGDRYISDVMGAVAAGSSSDPVGTIKMYAGSAAPVGYLICDGTLKSRTTYADLFAVTGFAYSPTPGTDPGGNNFYIPDKGRVFVGLDSSQGEFNVLGLRGGSKSATALHTHTMKNHSHGLATHYHGLENHIHTVDNHGHNLANHSHGGGTGVHAHTCWNNVYVSGTPAHGHDGAGDQSSERPNATTGWSSPGNPTNSVGVGNSGQGNNEAPNTGNPWNYGGAGAPFNVGGGGIPSDNTSDGSSVGATSGNLVPYQVVNFIIKI